MATNDKDQALLDLQLRQKTNKLLMLTGMGAGIISRTLTSPLERIRILQQTGASNYANKGVFQSLRHMYAENGVRGLFRGNGVNQMTQAPFTALEFYFYDVFKNNLFSTDAASLTYQQKMVCGGLTGMSATLVVYPMDVVKTYLTINQK